MLQPETSRFICRIRARELISIGRQPILQTLAQQGDTGSLLRSLGPQGLRHPARCLPDQQASLGERPPQLADYLDHEVAVEVEVPAMHKTILITGVEVNTSG